MRANGFITVVIPFDGNWENVEGILKNATAQRGDNQPNHQWCTALSKEPRLIHFLSMTVVGPCSPMDGGTPPPSRGNGSYLLIEVSSDTGPTETLHIVAKALEGLLVQVFSAPNVIWRKPSLMRRMKGLPESNVARIASFMVENHRVVGDEWGMALGQLHDGSPGMTAERIVAERDLAKRVTDWIDNQRSDKKNEWINGSPMQRLEAVRTWLWDAVDPEPKANVGSTASTPVGSAKWAFAAEPAQVLQAAPPAGKMQDLKAAYSIAHKLLWPLYIALTAALIVLYWMKRVALHPDSGKLADLVIPGSIGYRPLVQLAVLVVLLLLLWLLRRPRQYPFIALVVPTFVVITVFDSFGEALLWFLLASVTIAVATVALVLLGRWRLRTLEARDPVDDHAPGMQFVHNLMEVENRHAQNHMFTVSTIKPGLLRRLALRYILTMIGANPFVSRPGFLGKNGVIHSARWLWIADPKWPWFRGRLIFWSNFDGTWESYVGDFVADSPDGVTGLWSNCVGFPRAKNLTDEGAKNRDRLVRWARRQQKPTTFWYSAYQDLTNARIRINAAIRQGIASAQTDADASDWLALFASQPRLPGTLVTSQIPTLVFGGLAKLPYATCYMIRLPEDTKASRTWLQRISEDVTFGELLPGQTTAVALGLSASALEKLGVPKNSIDTFPVPFQEGMWTEERARALGDEEHTDSHPSKWEWGSIRKSGLGTTENNTVDVVLVIYGATQADVDKEYRHLLQTIAPVRILKHVKLSSPSKEEQAAAAAAKLAGGNGSGKKLPRFRTEHFGFADGVSQPAIIGLRREQHTAHNDRVYPGEIVLGYPDNLKRIPPTPLIDASEDPEHILADDDGGADPYRQRPDFSRYPSTGRRDLGANGTFLVVRQLQQHVYKWDELLERESINVFNEFVTSADGMGSAAIVWGDPKEMEREPVAVAPLAAPSTLSATGVQRPAKIIRTKHVQPKDLEHAIAAKILGRWRDGSPLVRHPMTPGKEEGALQNNFRFGVEDPQGLACPLGAHIRRANPRDTRFPGSQEEIDSVNRHRLLRVGRAYGKWLKKDDVREARKSNPDGEPEVGLMFMCLNADIERQYEFVQKTWILNRNMNGLDGETCPLTGQGGEFSIPTPRGPIKLGRIEPLVTVRGGGYFFMPGLAALKFLSHVDKKPKGPGLSPPRQSTNKEPLPDNVSATSLVGHEQKLETASAAIARMKAGAC